MATTPDSNSTSTPPRRRPPLTWMQVLGLAGIVFLVVVVFDFNRRLAEQQRLMDAAQLVNAEVIALETEHAALQTQVAYATTDAAVIEWAHEHGRMVQPGEVLVVPIIPTQEATSIPTATPLPPTPPNWVLWWEAFFPTGQ